MSVEYPTAYETSSLGSLSGEQRQYLNAAFNRGLSANAALGELSAAGIGIRRTEGLAAYRAIGGVRAVTAGINNTPFAFQPSARLFVPARYEIGYTYRVWANVTATNTVTGETMILRHVLGFDELMSRQQILEAISQDMANAEDVYQVTWETNDITITTAESNPP